MANTNLNGDAFTDLRRAMGEWKMPNIDLEAVAQTQRRNIEALTQANQLALEGTQAWIRRNMELARQGMEELQAMVSSASMFSMSYPFMTEQSGGTGGL